jgi:hypothetical protein
LQTVLMHLFSDSHGQSEQEQSSLESHIPFPQYFPTQMPASLQYSPLEQAQSLGDVLQFSPILISQIPSMH